MLQNKELLIFDFDGTICDNKSIHEAAFKKCLDNYKNIIFEYDEISGMKTKDAFRLIFKKFNVTYSEAILTSLTQKKQMLARESLHNKPMLMNGFLTFLKLVKNKRKCIVSSGSRQNIEHVLQHFNILNEFEFILDGSDVTLSKPSPEGFLKAINIAQCSRDLAIIFEDSDSGFIAASASEIEYFDITKTSWSSLTKNYQNTNLL